MSPRVWEERVRCPCCGCPTLAAEIPDQSCVLCEWLVDGLPADDVPDAEELSGAREHFRMHLSMYAPDDRPPWSPDPPTPEELEVKRDLVALYAEVLAEEEGGKLLRLAAVRSAKFHAPIRPDEVVSIRYRRRVASGEDICDATLSVAGRTSAAFQLRWIEEETPG